MGVVVAVGCGVGVGGVVGAGVGVEVVKLTVMFRVRSPLITNPGSI